MSELNLTHNVYTSHSYSVDTSSKMSKPFTSTSDSILICSGLRGYFVSQHTTQHETSCYPIYVTRTCPSCKIIILWYKLWDIKLIRSSIQISKVIYCLFHSKVHLFKYRILDGVYWSTESAGMNCFVYSLWCQTFSITVYPTGWYVKLY